MSKVASSTYSCVFPLGEKVKGTPQAYEVYFDVSYASFTSSSTTTCTQQSPIPQIKRKAIALLAHIIIIIIFIIFFFKCIKSSPACGIRQGRE